MNNSANTSQSIKFSAPLSPASQLLYWPLWWYSAGVAWIFRQSLIFLKNQSRSLNIGVWLRYLFVPMFGQTDIASRFISFFVRLAQIVFRTFAIIIIFLLVISIITLWLLIPFIIILALISQIFN